MSGSGNQPSCPPQPACGPQGDSTDDILTTLLALLGILGTLGTVVGIIVKSTSVGTIPILGTTGMGVGSIGLSAAAAAAAVMLTTIVYWYKRCLQSPDGLNTCTAGVVDNIVRAFDSPTDYLYPFIAQHDMVSVVVQCQYWPIVEQAAQYIYCNTSTGSPEIRCYYKNDAVCATDLGSVIGAVAAGIAGIVLGILAGAAIGCVGAGPAYVFCLIIACIIAALIAGVLALAGAIIGGDVAHIITGDTRPTDDHGNVISVGDYLTACGTTIINGDDNHARTYWFVQTSALHGTSSSPPPAFSHTDPDMNLPLTTCGELCPDSFSGGQLQ